MLKRLMTVAMIATLMLGTAWGANQIDMDTTTALDPWSVAAGDEDYLIDSGVTSDPATISSVTIAGDGSLYIGADDVEWAAGTGTGADLTVTITNLTMNGTVGTDLALLGVAENTKLTIGNAVTFNATTANQGNRLDIRGGSVMLSQGGTFEGNRAAVIYGGGELLNADGKALLITENGGIWLSGYVADGVATSVTGANFNLGDVVVEVDVNPTTGVPTGSAIGYDIRTGGGANNSFDAAEIELNSLTISSGMVRTGRQETTFTVLGKTAIGGSADYLAGLYGGTYQSVATLRIDNFETVYFEDDISVLGGAEIYTSNAAGTNAAAQAVLSGNVILSGNDAGNGTYGTTYGWNDQDWLNQWAILEANPNGAPLVFLKDVDAASKLLVTGTNNNIRGNVTFGQNPTITGSNGWIDMEVNMYARDGWVQDYINANTGIAGMDQALLYESNPRYGEKFTGVMFIGDIAAGNNPWATSVTVGNYTQNSGLVIGTDTNFANDYRGMGWNIDNGGFPPAAATLNIKGTTTVTGGMFAVNANVEGDMAFGNYSTNFVDRAVLGGGGTNSIINVTNDSLTLAVNKNGMIYVPSALTLVGMNTVVDSEGDVLFDSSTIATNGNGLNEASFVALNSGSIKFTEEYMKNIAFVGVDASTPVGLINSGSNPDASINVASVQFSGLLGTFATGYNATSNQYQLIQAVDSGLDFSGSVQDFGDANAMLTAMYGDQTNYGLNTMIYKSVSEGDPAVITIPYERLYIDERATSDNPFGQQLINQFNMNMENLQHIGAGRSEANSVLNLYNGNAMNGVNMVSQAVARSHIRASLNRSDDIRETWNLVKNTVTGGDGLASGIMNSCYTNRVWVGGFGLWEDADDRGGLAGYKYKSGGFVVGYDKLIGQNVIVGGSFAYNTGDFEDKAAIGHDSDIDNYSFNLYATYTHCSGFFGTLFGGYTYSDNDISETYLSDLNKRANSQHDNHTNTWVVGGKIGYDWRPNERFYITPSIGFTYINARSSAHTAYLGGNVLGQFSKLKDDAYYLPIEINLGYDVWSCEDAKLNLNLNVGYAYNFDEDGVSGNIGLAGFQNGVPYGVQSREQGHHLFNVGGGVTYSKGRFDFGVKYDYYMQKDADTHRVLGTVGFKF